MVPIIRSIPKCSPEERHQRFRESCFGIRRVIISFALGASDRFGLFIKAIGGHGGPVNPVAPCLRPSSKNLARKLITSLMPFRLPVLLGLAGTATLLHREKATLTLAR